MLNLHPSSYLLRATYLVLFLALMCLAGCDSKSGSGLGSVAGIAQLSDPDQSTGHAGILMFFAGTPYQARTDQQGRYRIDGVPAGTYELVAEKSGFQGQVIEGLTINPAEHSTDNPLQPRTALLELKEVAETTAAPAYGTINGTSYLDGVNENDNGGIRVEVDGTAFVTVTGNNGQYRILNVDPGSYTLSYHKAGYRSYTSEEVNVTTGVTELEPVALELVQQGDIVSPSTAAAAAAVVAATAPAQAASPPGPNEKRSIVGIVELKDAQGQPVLDYSNVTVAINGTDTIAEINDQGQFRLDNLTSGTYTVIGTVEGGNLVQIPVDLESQRSVSIVVKLGPEEVNAQTGGGSIKGKAVLMDAEEKPLPDASGVQIAVNGTQYIATTAADGAFTITGVPPGTYALTASKENFESQTVSDVQVNAASPIDVGEVSLPMKVDRPRVVATNPTGNAKKVPVSRDLFVTVKFSQKMDPATVRNAVTLSPSTPFTASIGKGSGEGAEDDTLVLRLSNEDPKAPIQFGAQYRVSISASAANYSGITMAEPYSFSFQTDEPGVIATTPAQNADGVYVNQNDYPVTISFNTKLDPKTINDRNIRVKPDGGVSVSTTYTNAQDTGWTLVRVATQWKPDTNYTITVSKRVRAFNGQALGNTPYTLKFRTQPIEIIQMPIIEVR